MSLKKCENCGVFFGAKNNETLCDKCRNPVSKKALITGDVEHDKFTNARSIVYDQPQITPKELVDELNNRGIKITIKEVMKYVTEGRLTLVTVDGGTYCNSCGRKISIGTMCKDCTAKLDKFRKPAQPVKAKTEETKRSHGMHTAKK